MLVLFVEIAVCWCCLLRSLYVEVAVLFGEIALC